MKLILALVLSLAGTFCPLPAQVSVTNAEIRFEFVSKEVKGTIKGFQSNTSIDFDHPENSTFEGSVAVETLDTDNGLRNWHLKRGKYFNEDDYPRISFRSTTVSEKDNTYIVTGNLSLKGTTKSLKINFTRKGNQLEGKTFIYTSDYGINIKKKREDNLVNITLLFNLE